MDKLTIEQKAQRYDEAIEVAKRKLCFDNAGMIDNFTPDDIREIFPELKKPEDEEIRKGLIENFKWFCGDYPETAKWGKADNLLVKDILAWLEKQNPIMAKSPQLGEQKPVDIAPKFHEGEWVVSPNGVYWHIDKISNNRYEVTSNTGESSNWNLDTNIYHKFTIQDAKDSDVLACNINKAEIGGDIEKLPNITPTICIYQKSVKDHDYIHSRCSLYNGSSLVLSNTMYYNTFVYDIRPATKEQREQLEKAMADAGYTFNFEKKELKKVSQRMISAEAKEAMYGKPTAWSKEDELKRSTLIHVVKKLQGSAIFEGLLPEELIAWLKSLKERIIE